MANKQKNTKKEEKGSARLKDAPQGAQKPSAFEKQESVPSAKAEQVHSAKKEALSSATYKHMIAGLTPPFIVIEIMFAALAAYLFATRSDQPMLGGIFLIFAAILLAVYLVLFFWLRASAKRAKVREKEAPRR